MCEVTDVGMGILLVIASCFDIRRKCLPVWFLIGMNLCSVVLCIAGYFAIGRNTIMSIVGGVLVGVFFLLISKVTGESIGYGDSWMILILGIYLGFRRLLAVVFFASFLAGLLSLLLYCKHRSRKLSLPFVPFLTAAYGLAVIL